MKKTVVKKIVTLMLIVALCATIAIALVACDDKKANAPVVDQNGNAIVDGVTTSLPKGIVYTADAVTTAEPVTRTFNATVTPNNATNKELIWSLDWKNASSEWASGKNLGDYLTLSSSGMSATLTCTQPFGEQAIITVRSADNTDISKNCTVDYKSKIERFVLDVYQDNLLIGTVADQVKYDGMYDESNAILSHNHRPVLSIGHILDPAHNIAFQLRPVFTLGSVGNNETNIEYTVTGGVSIVFNLETIKRFSDSKSASNIAPYKNLAGHSIKPEQTNTKEQPFNPFDKHTLALGTSDIKNFFFYNGFMATDSQVRDVVNFASNNNLCLLRVTYSYFKCNNVLYGLEYCLGVDNTTLNVAVSDVTIDNSQVII